MHIYIIYTYTYMPVSLTIGFKKTEVVSQTPELTVQLTSEKKSLLSLSFYVTSLNFLQPFFYHDNRTSCCQWITYSKCFTAGVNSYVNFLDLSVICSSGKELSVLNICLSTTNNNIPFS